MLEGKNSCRRQDGYLSVILHGLEGRSHGDFGLAVPHISAKQPIHRHARFHVVLDVVDRGRLIFGLVVVESIFELTLPLCIRGKAVALCHLSLRIELKQFIGHIAHGLLHTSLCLGPLCAAETTQRRPRAFGRAILLD